MGRRLLARFDECPGVVDQHVALEVVQSKPPIGVEQPGRVPDSIETVTTGVDDHPFHLAGRSIGSRHP